MGRPSTAGPGSRSMFGTQVSSKRPSSAAYGFGTGTREHSSKIFVSPDHAKLEPNKSSPSPSAYTLPRSVGQQPDGRKATMPQWAFGTAERFTYEKKSKANPGLLLPALALGPVTSPSPTHPASSRARITAHS